VESLLETETRTGLLPWNFQFRSTRLGGRNDPGFRLGVAIPIDQWQNHKERQSTKPGRWYGKLRRMIYSTKSLRPGLVVQDPVRDAKGMILLPAGVSLTDSHIAQLLQRGVPAISVAAQENEEEMLARVTREREQIVSLFGEKGATVELEQLRRLMMEKTDAC